MTRSPTEVERASGVSRRQLWLGLILPTAAWAGHGMLGTLVALLSCKQFGIAERSAPAFTRPILFGLSLVALGVVVFSVVSSLRILRRITGSSQPVGQQGHQREEFMAMAAVFFSVTFAFGIALNAVPVLVLANVCEGTR
jgi:tellurite resistance protein TehA-like permease